MNSRKTNSILIENITVQVPNAASIIKVFCSFLEENDLSTYVWNYEVNSPTPGPLANYSKLLVSDTTIFFDQNTCFLKDVLDSKQKISYLLGFDQIVYIYHENIEDKFP